MEKKLFPYFDLQGISPEQLQILCEDLLFSNLVIADFIRTISKTGEVKNENDTNIFLMAHEFTPARLERFKNEN